MTPETKELGLLKTLAAQDEEIKTLRAQVAQYKEDAERYRELLFAVAKKYHGETRHQTALRYIRQAEFVSNVMGDKARKS